MKEEEAREKWCPMGRGDWAGDGGINRMSMSGGIFEPSPDCMCIASDCACWVWDKEESQMMMGDYGHCGLIRSERIKLLEAELAEAKATVHVTTMDDSLRLQNNSLIEERDQLRDEVKRLRDALILARKEISIMEDDVSADPDVFVAIDEALNGGKGDGV